MTMCAHLMDAEKREQPVKPSAAGCGECLAAGSSWVSLRICLTCGHVGCCDSSPNRHATRHYEASKHPVIRSFQPGEEWGYCYPDEAYAETLRALPGESAPVPDR